VIRLIALDVDGTLVGTRSQVSDATTATLRAAVASGVYVTLATARSFQSARRFAEPFGLNAPLIVHAGALVKDPTTGQTIHECLLPLESAVAIAAFCDEHNLQISVPLGELSYMRLHSTPERLPAHVRLPERIAPFLTVAPMSLWVIGEEAIDAVLDQFAAPFSDQVRFSRAFNGDGSPVLALTAVDANKGTGLAALCRALDIDPAEVMAVGDADVDVPMFALAGLSVALSNAAPEVQAAADIVAPHVDDDGAAWAVRELVLTGIPRPAIPALASETQQGVEADD
jgi:Cof subfamily protein (haloacid dehalogenase superfamily)